MALPIPPRVIWFTGLPASGKSTIALALTAQLTHRGLKTEWLNADRIRETVPNIGFSPADRARHIQYMGYFASRLEDQGIWVVADFISPYMADRIFARHLCQRFLEVYFATPLGVCERRDPKGLYKKARAGNLPNFTGIDAPYEAPENPEITLDTASMPIERCVERIIESCRFPR